MRDQLADGVTGWRTHREGRKGFTLCRDVECTEAHFITSFKGSRPTRYKWEGIGRFRNYG